MTDYSTSYDPDADFDRWYTLATAEAIAERFRYGDRVLEMGCATGLMTAELVKTGALVTGVDRSFEYLTRAATRHLPGTRWVQSDVFAYSEGFGPYDHVVTCNLIHELPQPDEFLRHCRRLLVPGGLLHLASQNPQSIHRLAALDLGLIDSLDQISERGQRWATLRLFTADELEALCRSAGFEVIALRGIMLKPLPNEQMEKLPDMVLLGFKRIAHRFPEHCAVNYLVAQA